MKFIALFSGGKDSTYALYIAMQQAHKIEKLVTIIPRRKDSYMYHVPAIERTKYQAEAMGIPQDFYSIGDDMEELKKILEKYDVDGVVSGAIASNYQKTKIEEICTDLGLISYAPLWGKEQKILLEDMISAGMKIMIISASAYGLDSSYLGRIIDRTTVGDLMEIEKKYAINVSGEGGEYETYVLDAPFFKNRIEITEYEKIWDGMRGEILIKDMKLIKKDKVLSFDFFG